MLQVIGCGSAAATASDSTTCLGGLKPRPASYRFEVSRCRSNSEAALFWSRSNLWPFEVRKKVGNGAPTHGATTDVAVFVSTKKSDLAGADENCLCALLAREGDLRRPTGNTLQVKIARGLGQEFAGRLG